ncbi:hypothetical protein [Geminisphaera colitermitum]|uniref:hypothetical protein n=1 Tax=Geminisphaera colitermitum TaxID=1148786 RepID=UPI000158D582|nr:hypothetical protein [Geminisphaera colitermitum]
MPAKPSTELTREEHDQLTRCEANIERGLTSIGAALKTIRDKRLYRETHHSFDVYCHERWHKSKTWATYQIAAAIFAEKHPEASEAEARRLSRDSSHEQNSVTNVTDKGQAIPAATPAKPTKADRYREQIRALAEMDREALDRATQQSIGKLAETMAKREQINLHSRENKGNKALRDEYEQRAMAKLAPGAQMALAQLEENPALSVSRAYVGVFGSVKKGDIRGDTDHLGNFHAGLRKLATSFPHWEKFSREDRAHFVQLWVALRSTMPKAFLDDLEAFAPARKGGRS